MPRHLNCFTSPRDMPRCEILATFGPVCYGETTMRPVMKDLLFMGAVGMGAALAHTTSHSPLSPSILTTLGDISADRNKELRPRTVQKSINSCSTLD